MIHTASPVGRFAEKEEKSEGIKIAVEGTLSVLRACTAASVRKVVVTSSTASIG